MASNRSRTLIIAVGGTGLEILSRTRKGFEDKYGDASKYPLLSYLWIDTDRKEKISNPQAAGSPLKENEKCWASVTSKDAKEIILNLEQYPWIYDWYPSELERNPNAVTAGAGQIRAQGRFAFFCNYRLIRDKVIDACRRTKGHETKMLESYGITVIPNSLNIYVVGSFSGGTGSGMLIDLCYCIKHWLQGEATPLITSIIPLPSLFAGVDVGERIQTNAYAAFMELSYYCDHRTQYIARFSGNLTDEIRASDPPSDFTYLVDTKNDQKEFNPEQVRQITAKQLEEEIDSEVGYEKRTIRDNMKGAWAQADPGGRGYPKCFLSFGRSTVETPIVPIYAYFSYRLGEKLLHWWLNEEIKLPPKMLELVRDDIFKPMRLTLSDLLSDLGAAEDRPYEAVISDYINSIRDEVTTNNLLECTQQGMSVLGAEKGQILQFLPYLKSKVDTYVSEHFREISPDERLHGDYLKKIYDNRANLILQTKERLTEQFYTIIEDRIRGPKFADDFLIRGKEILTNYGEVLRRQQDILAQNKEKYQENYQNALSSINEFKDKWGMTKQAEIEVYFEEALDSLDMMLKAIIQHKCRASALMVVESLCLHLNSLEDRLNRWTQTIKFFRDRYAQQSKEQINQADAVFIDGAKLFDRPEFNRLFQDLISQYGGSQGDITLALDKLCQTLSQGILSQASPLWKEERGADEIMRLLDITEIPDLKQDNFREIIDKQTKEKVVNAPNSSSLHQDLAAADRLFKVYKDNAKIVEQLRSAIALAKPLINLSSAAFSRKDIGFTPLNYKIVALTGGSKTTDPAAQKLLPLLEEFYAPEDVKPLSATEDYKIVFYEETGGFSLRCLEDLPLLRQAYLDWKGKWIVAKRAQLRGENQDPPIPVHTCKEPPFWDLFPEDAAIFKLLVQARALVVLHQKMNRANQENVIYYSRNTPIGPENVSLASSWQELPQILEVKACRGDREEIQRQVNKALDNAQTIEQKDSLFNQLTNYLEQRKLELENEGGEDSKAYLRERQIILEVIETYKLQVEIDQDVLEATLHESPLNSLPPISSNKSESQLNHFSSSNSSESQLNNLPSSNSSESITLQTNSVNGSKSQLLAELQQLAEFKREGILSEEEFQQAKQRLLNG